MDLAAWAEGEARRRLSRSVRDGSTRRAVAARAREIASVCEPDDRVVLVAAAFLHDVGYDPDLARTGFHPLDGARWLAAEGHARLAGLVAHHTCARFEAHELGLAGELDEFADEASAVSDALTYCDLTTGPAGERTTSGERLREIERRYGADHAVARALHRASECLSATVERTERRLEATARASS